MISTKRMLPLLMITMLLLSSVPMTTWAREEERRAKVLIKIVEEHLEHIEELIEKLEPLVGTGIIEAKKESIADLKSKLIEAKELFEEGAYDVAIALALSIMEGCQEIYREIYTVEEVLEVVRNATSRVSIKGREEAYRCLCRAIEAMAREANATHVFPLLKKIMEEIDRGNLTGASLHVASAAGRLRERALEKMHEKAREMVKRILGRVEEEVDEEIGKGVEEAVRGLERAIERLSGVLDHLSDVIEHLKEVNASPAAIEAIELAKSRVERVIELLKSIKSDIEERRVTIPKRRERRRPLEGEVGMPILEVIGLEVPHEVRVGEDFEVKVRIINVGNATATVTVVISCEEVVISSIDITIGPGEIGEAELELMAPKVGTTLVLCVEVLYDGTVVWSSTIEIRMVIGKMAPKVP